MARKVSCWEAEGCLGKAQNFADAERDVQAIAVLRMACVHAGRNSLAVCCGDKLSVVMRTISDAL
ncbi:MULTISPECIES: hypothetical protein [unclassified Pseudovibrio]|uniref:hypothetical protein n=1 Tax=unclassified Pseudovibrio TaxID=2627060 RepID=UPI00128FF3A3|nr:MULTISPECIES: hypothetical protein [unclassified Pseudovibrio]